MNIETKEISYPAGAEEFTGYLAYDAASTEPRPGVIVVHEWWGHDAYVRGRAEQLAADGFSAFALDMYGSGKSAQDPAQANELMTAVLSETGAVEERFVAAMQVLQTQPQTDAELIHAAGYCFGGAVVLAMARAGKPLQSVATFHGLLETETPMQSGVFAGEIAAFTGADDPMVAAEIVEAFEQEMRNAGVTCSLTSYPGVVHGFTNPAATERGRKYELPLAYDAEADADSYRRMIELFRRNNH